MVMPGKKYLSTGQYRYGFNGKENDNEIKGEGNQQDYGMRIYDSRLGRFLSVDPLSAKYPELTPYQFASNTPNQAIDLDGLEAAGVGCGCPMRQLMSVEAMQQTGVAMIATFRGFGKAAFNTVKGTVHSVTHPIQTIKSVAHAVSHPGQTWNNVKVGLKQWKNNLLSSDPNVAGEATGEGIFYVSTGLPTVISIGKSVSKLIKNSPTAVASEVRTITSEQTNFGKTGGNLLSYGEQGIVKEVNSILASPEFQVIRDANKSGTFAEVSINGRKVLYEPDLPSSGFTLLTEDGFLLGNEAFKSNAELGKSLLQELYRLKYGETLKSGLAVGQNTTETNAAFNFAEKALEYIKHK
jgi:RHS repeat-associated protein